MCLLRLPQPIQKKTCRIGESPPVGIGHALQRHSSTFPAVVCRSRSLKHVCCKLTYCKWAFLNKSLIKTCFLHYMLSEVRKWRLKRVWCTQLIPLSNKHYSNIIILYNVYIYNYIYIIIILEFHKPNRTPPSVELVTCNLSLMIELVSVPRLVFLHTESIDGVLHVALLVVAQFFAKRVPCAWQKSTEEWLIW